MRLGPKGALGYAIQRETPGSESIQNAVTLSSFEIKVTGSRDVNIAAVSPARVAWRYRWVKGKAPVGVPGLHFLEGAFLHGALGGHPPSFSFDINSTHAISPRSARLKNFSAVGATDPPGRASLILLRPSQQLQLGDAGCSHCRLILCHQIGRSASARLAFKINIGHGEVVGVADGVRDSAIFLDCRRWRGAAIGHTQCEAEVELKVEDLDKYTSKPPPTWSRSGGSA
jgi:hypothetical protein